MALSAPSAYCRPGDDVAPNATWSVTSGTADALYPVANLGNRNPAKPFKATGTSVTVRATFGAAQVLVGAAFVNHNLEGAGVTVTSGSGLSQPVTIGANQGGQCTNAAINFETALLAQRTSTTFDAVITGGLLGPIAIGEILLLTAWRDLLWLWGLQIKPKRGIVQPGETFGGSLLQYDKGVRIREVSGKLEAASEEAAMIALEAEAKGSILPWLLWPNVATNEILYVKFARDTFATSPQSIGFTDTTLQLIEVSSGSPLF